MPSRSPEARVSVVMPVFNAMPHLDDAVRSVLGQSFAEFEFVIYDDASTDGSTEALREWAAKDKRIRLFEGARNLGPVGSSMFVVEHSTAPLIARMDADDISLPSRLERQVALLRERPSAGLVGTLFEIIDEQGRRIRGPDYWRLAPTTPFVPFAAHGSILFRRSVFDQVGGYRRECEYWEDQDLAARMASAAEAWVLPEALYQVRQWVRKTSARTDIESIENAVHTAYQSIGRLEENRWYDDLLNRDRPEPVRLDPRVFIASGSRTLWAGERPWVLSRLLRRGRLRLDAQSLMALVWASWASISPATLRAFLRMLLRRKNRKALKAGAGAEPLRWSPIKGVGHASPPGMIPAEDRAAARRLVRSADTL